MQIASQANHRVLVTTLSQLCQQYLPATFQLVMDIEGAEGELLMHDQAGLANCERLIAEYHATEIDSQAMSVDDLISLTQERHGFRIVDRYGSVCCFTRS